MGVRKTKLIIGMRRGLGRVHSHIDIIMQLRRRSIRVINYSCMCQTVCDTVYHTLMESNICLKQVNKDLRILRVRKDPLCRLTRHIIPCIRLIYTKYAIAHRSFALIHRFYNFRFPLFFPLFSGLILLIRCGYGRSPWGNLFRCPQFKR